MQDSIVALGGLALLLFLASGGSNTAVKIKQNLQSIDEIFEEYATARNEPRDSIELMERFLKISESLRRLGKDDLQKMKKDRLLHHVKTISKDPPSLLVSFASLLVHKEKFTNWKLAKKFFDQSLTAVDLALDLFEKIFATLPGENIESALVYTAEAHSMLIDAEARASGL